MQAWYQEVWPRCKRLGEAAAMCCCSSTTTTCPTAATATAEAAVTNAPLVLRYVPRLVAYLPLAGAVGFVGAIASECGSAHSAGIENFSLDGVLRLRGSAAALVIAVSAPLLLDGTAARVFAVSCAGNAAGSLAMASGAAAVLFPRGSPVAEAARALAERKSRLGAGTAFCKAVVANFLVCTAVYMASASKTVSMLRPREGWHGRCCL